ncbi:hypothetical protein CkaCkLH20_03288 [Colletotrichum karsti]|uniref:Uncharacterized protein n=1 Tax=Colletotrichum karsti TaxID=1095194 RepID=A0A9P6IHH1_9PEZI|nr:uncharacterized protein CkaCkLH20_03288 [Colletotrichum karsti]KAF9879055.1 hypothetical protein CkaCkLH20_03288 [Colletotrichum karsti]
MASHQGQNHDRGFREAVLGRCFVQTGTERFGDGAHDIIRQRERDHLNHIETDVLAQGVPVGQIYTGAPQDGRDAQEPSLEKLIPKMPYYRNNCTALSQRYNLYFAAYENRIFVYRPKSVPKQALPREPNLILATKPDTVAKHVSGTLDGRFHHQSNAIATGFLGREEVLVSVYDDGSVFAWYIRPMAEYVDHASSDCHCKFPIPTHFFSDNVGKSAWGIAVHQKSRLIAISSNRFEVTVFAFGLSRLPEAMERRSRPLDYCESSVLKRKRNWRIVVPLGDGGHNIPNVALWDDDEGFAEKVVAIDINGTVWVMDIWKVGTAAVRIPHRANLPGQWNFRNPMGWGVAVLPYESFLTAYNATDLLGLRESEIMNAKPPHTGRWIEVQRGLPNIRNHPTEMSARDVPEPEAFHATLHMQNGVTWNQFQFMQNLMAQSLAQQPPPPPAQTPPQTQWEAQIAAATTEQIMEAATIPEWAEESDAGTDDEPVAAAADGPGPSWEAQIAAATSEDLAAAAADGPFYQQEDDTSSEEDVILTLAEDNTNGAPLVSSPSVETDDDDASSFGQPFLNENQPPALNGPLEQLDLDPEENDYIFIEEAVGAAYESMGPVDALTQVLPPDGTCNFIKSASGARSNGLFQQSSWLDMVYFPHSGKTYVAPTTVVGRLQFHRRDRIRNRNTTEQDREVLEELGRRCCILRTYEHDIEMRSIIEDDGAAVFCRDPISWKQPRNQLLQYAERLNMIVHVPELSLVVIGSAIGRVMLLTPTRSPYGLEGNGFTVKSGYRIDWVLPTRDDDEEGRRPPRGLYGIAVGPVPEGGAPGCLLRPDNAPAPSPALRRYRLMLHYRDHRILSYDIGRDERGEHLLIF